VFGKTGTAETFVEGVPYDQSWYVAYVPHPSKPIVIAATVERGGFGADRAAPLVRRMLAKWFDLDPQLARPSAGASVRQAAD
jgi:penicillin-binding protein 2